MVYNAQKGYFKEQRSVAEINQLFKGLNNVSSPAKTATLKINGKVMSDEGGGGMSDEPTCTDWYWVEPIYDGNGNIIGEVWTYLNRTCSTTGGGDGGSGSENEPEPIVEFGEADDTPIGATIEESSSEQKIVNVSWYCYKVNGKNLRFKSYEKVKIEPPIMGTQWLVADITHTSMSPEGSIEGQGISPILNWSQGETTMNSAWAKMKLNFKDKRTYYWKGILRTRYSPDINAARAWGIYELIGY
ncbi:hypothetical protein HQN85_08700 [Pedobacter boryungensis]|uniref:Uncharacterized protein n=2 Tax=Pedobacter boryungensis TaxID=869962 RepID=A0ABX2DCJ3_9SPHI|nr:hypothetical protein [Pedobacter boryungensis]